MYKHLQPFIKICSLVIAITLLGACRQVKPRADASEPSPPAISVQLANVESSIVRSSSEFVANLESRKSVNLQPRVTGQISRIFVKAGDKVKAGAPLLQIDEKEQRALVVGRTSEVEEARANVQRVKAGKQQAQAKLMQTIANVKNAEANLKTLEAERIKTLADLKFNRTQYQRYTQLQAEGAVSLQMRDQFTNSFNTAKAAVDAAEARIQAARASIESQRSNITAQQAEVEAQRVEIVKAEQQIQQAQANLKEQQARLQYYTITAPFDGIVGDIPVKQGDVVSTETKLALLTQNDALEVNISIPVKRAKDVRIGSTVELTNARGQTVGNSRVFFISPNVNNNTQSILVKARLNNPSQQLRADEFVQARVIWEEKPALKVPSVAISRIAGESFVFVTEQSKNGLVVRQRAVELGSIEGNNYHVSSGLKAGEQIAVTGLLQLSDGAAIVPKS